jgi:L-alanine-DL-glutamate epimerase-like enolase superfamily enzyme
LIWSRNFDKLSETELFVKEWICLKAKKLTAAALDAAADLPVLTSDILGFPVIIESIELLYNGRFYIVRSRSKDGAEGIAVTNNKAAYLYQILKQCVIPYFINKDARDLEALLDWVFVANNNYKLAGLALWCCIAWVEFSILDLLGQTAQKSVAQLLGTVQHTEIPIYVASGRRDTTPEQEVAILQKRMAETGAQAVKFKVGGRMSKNADSLSGRTEGLIRLSRKILGDAITIYADGNGSYDPPRAIEIGKLLEDINAYFYEEPCPFDHLEDTKTVAATLTIPIAGGEQETSLRRFRWMILNNAVQVVQPDLHYNGGMIRTIRVARMAAVAGKPITLHISDGLCYLQMLHFAAITPNIGRFQEFKTGIETTGAYFDPPLRASDGKVNVPTRPGWGIADLSELMNHARLI